MASMVQINGKWINAERVAYLEPTHEHRSTQVHFTGDDEGVRVVLPHDQVAHHLNMTGTADQVLAGVFKMMVNTGLVGISNDSIVIQKGEIPHLPDMFRAVITAAIEESA